MKKIILSIALLICTVCANAQPVTLIVSNETDCNVDYSLFGNTCLLDETMQVTIPAMSTHNYYDYATGAPITPVWWLGTPAFPPIVWTAIKFGFYNGCFAGATIGSTACGYSTSWNSSGMCLCQGHIVYADWIPLPPPFAPAIWARIHY